MNSQYLIKLKSDDDKNFFTCTIPSMEHQTLFCRYLYAAAHLRELDQLFRMMLFNLNSLMERYDLRFNDSVYSRRGNSVDPIELNALVCNAVSSGRTLVDSMEVFTAACLSDMSQFKDNYICQVYNNSVAYRIIDTLRNFMQHGHVPVSFDAEENKIYFDLSEILSVQHMKMNAGLRELLNEAEQQFLESEEITGTRITCVYTLYEYFLQIYNLYAEFYSYTEPYLLELVQDVRAVKEQHPEYCIQRKEGVWISAYVDEKDILHTFPADCGLDVLYRQNQAFAQEEYRAYRVNNGNLFSINMRYALENRIPVIMLVGDESEDLNLAEFCFGHFPDVHHLSFDKYYGKMEVYAIHKIYPYIQFEDGLQWNVPYEEVHIRDFLRTFPEARRQGLEALANNVGGAGELFEFLIHQWNEFFITAPLILQTQEIRKLLDYVDWAGRVATILAGYRWLKASFSEKREKKPSVHFLKKYIRRQDSWDLCELADILSAGEERLKIVLESCGYFTADGVHYMFDQTLADKIQTAQEKELQKRYDAHGTNVNCYSMNEAVAQLNVDLMYLAVLLMDENKLESFEKLAGRCLQPLEDYSDILYWDPLCGEVKIADTLPAIFDQEKENAVRSAVMNMDEEICRLCARLE